MILQVQIEVQIILTIKKKKSQIKGIQPVHNGIIVVTQPGQHLKTI